MESGNYSTRAVGPHLKAADAPLNPTNAPVQNSSSARGSRRQSRMRNHAMRTRARQLSAGKGTKRGFESLCGSDSDEESALLSSDSDHDASALLVPPIKARLMGKDLHESSGSLEAGQQAVSDQMTPSASALSGKTRRAYWKTDLSDPAGRVVSGSRKEVEAAESLLQLSTSSSVGRAGGGAREQGEEEPQPSTSTRSRRRAHRLQKPLSMAKRAEAEVPAAPALGNLAYWKTDLSDPAGGFVSDSREEVEAAEALQQLSMGSSVGLAGGGAREQGEEEPQPSTSTRSRRRAHRLRKPLSVAERAEAEVPAAPALGNLAYWKIALSDPAGGFVSDSREEVEAAEALQQLSMGSSVGLAGGGAREQGEEEPQPSTSTRSRRRAHRLRKPLSVAERAEAEVPAAPALGNLAYWKIALSDPAGGFVSDSREEVEAAEALQQLSMGSSVGLAGGGAREQGEEEPQPSTSNRSRRRAHRLQKPLSVAERAEAEVPAVPALGNLPISSHLFVRLPVVDKTKLLRRFSPATAVCEGWLTAKPTVLLSRAHDYLARPSLTPEEMEKLTYDAERLCKYLVHNKPPDERAPMRIVAEYLGLRFLYMDVIVATLQLLGEPPRGPWWERVTGKIRVAFPCHELTSRSRVKTHYSRMLVQHLSAALQVLVSGKRPSDVDLIKIKRMLFCSRLAPPRFRDSAFDGWRNDDGAFCSPTDPT